jgi:SPP1 gp7 family putative phage head morphogenesis protein
MGKTTIELGYDYEIEDKETLKLFDEYSIQLTSGITKELTAQIKAQIAEGLRLHENKNLIRNRIINLLNSPIKINVPEVKNSSGEVVRESYTYNMSVKNWATIVSRSETVRAYNQGRLTAYKKSELIDEVEFSTSGAERTCSRCIAQNGKKYKLNDSYGIIPLHPLCRCTWIPLLNSAKNLTNKIINFLK